MGRVLQLMGRIGQGGKLPAEEGHPEAPAGGVRDLRPANPRPVAAFLGQQIGRYILLRPVFPDAQAGAMAAVNIVFLRPEAVEPNPVIIRVQLHDHAELRRLRKPFHRGIAQGSLQAAAGPHPIIHLAAGRRGGRQGIGQRQGNAPVRLPDRMHLRVAGPGLRSLAAVRIQGGDLPLGIAEGHLIPVVVVDRRPPEVRHQGGLHILPAADAVGDRLPRQPAEHDLERVAPDGDIPDRIGNPQGGRGGGRDGDPGEGCRGGSAGGRRSGRSRGSLHRPDALAEGHLMAGRRPGCILPQPEADRRGVFARQLSRPEGQRDHRGGLGRHIHRQLLPGDFLSVPLQHRHAPEGAGGGEHMPVQDFHPLPADPDFHILIQVFHFLQLGGFPPVGEDDPVSAEDAVMGPVPPVPAVEQRLAAEAVPGNQGLIDEIPDEPALVALLLVCQLGILVHGAVGIAHGMGILAEDEGLLPMGFQILPDLRGRGIHLAFNVRDLPDPVGLRHMHIALVMHRASRIQPLHLPAHFQDHRAGQAFVSAAPDQHAGMVPVPGDHGADPVQQEGLPVLPVPGKHFLLSDSSLPEHIPHAVGFHIVLIDHIQPQLVAEPVQGGMVGIVAGSDRVDVVPLHQDQIPPDPFLRHRAAGLAAEVMAVDPPEHHADAVDPEHRVPDLHPAEADPLPRHLLRPVRGGQDDFQIIQEGILRGPEARVIQRQLPGLRRTVGAGRAADGPRLLREHFPVPAEGQRHAASRRGGYAGPPVQDAPLHRPVRRRVRLPVPEMGLRGGPEINIPVQAGEAQKILILQPASGAPAVHPAGQAVFPFPQGLRQLELMGRKAVGGKADIRPVQPDGHAALRPLEGDEDPLSRPVLRDPEGSDIAGDRIKDLRQLAGAEIRLPVPGILGIAVLRHAPALGLDMAGHVDILPPGTVIVRPLETRQHLGGVHGVEKLPGSVQAHPQGAFPRLRLLPARAGKMVGMGRHPVFAEIGGILQSVLVKHGNTPQIHSFFTDQRRGIAPRTDLFLFEIYHREDVLRNPLTIFSLSCREPPPKP